MIISQGHGHRAHVYRHRERKRLYFSLLCLDYRYYFGNYIIFVLSFVTNFLPNIAAGYSKISLIGKKPAKYQVYKIY